MENGDIVYVLIKSTKFTAKNAKGWELIGVYTDPKSAADAKEIAGKPHELWLYGCEVEGQPIEEIEL